MAIESTSRNGRLLALLQEGPATTGELVAETGWDRRNVCGRLTIQMRFGRVTRTPYTASGERSRWLWSLTTKGDCRG